MNTIKTLKTPTHYFIFSYFIEFFTYIIISSTIIVDISPETHVYFTENNNKKNDIVEKYSAS